jgi:glyceraldehyde 3-phosphate dehydrogenase
LAYLLKYDTVYGRWGKSVTAGNKELRIGGGSLPVLGERDPGSLPWRALGADLVFECTGLFNRREDLRRHIAAGARFVILSAPAKDEDIPTVVHGANTSTGGIDIISCASCTTNCIIPVVEVVGRRIGIRKATMTTIHAYTSTQAIVDAGTGDFRRGRAAAANLVPA